MRDRFRRLIWPTLFCFAFAEALFFVFLFDRAIPLGLRQALLSIAMIVSGALAAVLVSAFLAFLQSRWRILDVVPSQTGMALCIVLTAASLFLHLSPSTLHPLIPGYEEWLSGSPPEPSPIVIPDYYDLRGGTTLKFSLGPEIPWRLAYGTYKSSLTHTYLNGSIALAVVSWLVLIALAVRRRSRQAAPPARSILRHPVLIVGLGALFGAALLKAVAT